MRSDLSFIQIVKKYFNTAPILFPIIGLFHIGLLIYYIFFWLDFKVAFAYWLSPVVMGVYTVSWIGATFLKRKYAMTYLIFTMVMVLFFYIGPTTASGIAGEGLLQNFKFQLSLYHRALAGILLDPLPANIFFSFIILIYYKRMQSKSDVIVEEEKEAPSK